MLSYRHTKTMLALSLTIGALAPATGSAMPLRPDPPMPSIQPTSQVAPATANDGFDWADAGIGAAGGLCLSILAFSGGVAARRHATLR
jgi:hypothetical protein